MLTPPSQKTVHSATALHDFKQCARRYELKYRQRQPWPAPQAEPLFSYDLQQQRGQLFHRLVERYYLGMKPTLLTESIEDDLVHKWWLTFLEQTPVPQNSLTQVSAETRLSAEIQGCRFDVLYDLLQIDHERRKLTIFDWKTTPKPPQPSHWHNTVQTQLYLLVAGHLCQQFLGEEAILEDVSMVYWFPEHPHESVTIRYNTDLHDQYHGAIMDTVSTLEDMQNHQSSPWPLTENERMCNYCVYRSLCERGILGGALETLPDEPEEKDNWTALLDDLLF